MKTTNEIVIIGTSHHNTLSMVRAIAKGNYSPVLVLYGCKESYVAKSRHIKEAFYFPNTDSVLSFLKERYTDKSNRPILISCTDEIAHKLDICSDDLKPYMHFFKTEEKGNLTAYMDKQKQTELAGKLGFRTPKSISCLPKNIANEIDMVYPCIIKPLASIHGGKKLRICDNFDSLREAVKDFDDCTIQIQELVKKDYEIVIIGLTVDGISTIPAYIYKFREISGGTTYSKVCGIDDIPAEVVAASKKMIENIGYEGLWGIECIVSNDEYYFLELNLRNDATTFAVCTAGVNLPLQYVQSKSNIHYNANGKIEETYSIVEHNDFILTIKSKRNIFNWIKELNNSKCKYIYDKHDISPLFAMLKEYVSIFWGRFNKKS